MELSQGQIIQKPNKQGLSSIFTTYRLNVMKFHKYIPYGLGVMAQTRIGMDVCTGHIELSQLQIIQKPNKQELSSFFMTYGLNVMHAPVKFHKYISYGLGVMAGHRLGWTDVHT